MLKCTKIDFGWGFAPDPAGGAHSAPQIPRLDLRGLHLRGGKGRAGKRREAEEKGGEEKGRDERAWVWGPEWLIRP